METNPDDCDATGELPVEELSMIGETFSHYRIIEKLGQGGMGEVFLAVDSTLNRKVAIKFVRELRECTDTRGRKLLREARAAAALDHPFICKIYDTGVMEGRPFIAMEFVQGITLKQKLCEGPLNTKQALQIASEISEALEMSHERGIIHCDIKPANIMLTSQGHAKVMDFGIAVLNRELSETRSAESHSILSDATETKGLVGTISYMSPEQIRNEPLDGRSDVFALGIILYEMCTGRHPFRRERLAATASDILHFDPEPIFRQMPSFPADLETLIRRCLAKHKGDRYRTARDLTVALVDIKEKLSMAAVRTTYKPSVAVLPFANLHGSPDDDYFSDGITSEIIAKLAKLKNLLVISRTSVMRYKGSSADIRQVGRELGVKAILEGGVRREGHRCRIDAELVDVQDGFHLWADVYDFMLEDIFEIQDRVSGEIARALSVQLSPEEAAASTRARTSNVQAYQYFLKGKQFYYRFSDTDNRLALEAFERAITLDPEYAAAHAGLAAAYMARVERQWDGQAEVWGQRAMVAADRAIRLNPGISEPYSTRALLYYWQKRLDAARSELSQALDLDPNDDIAHNLLGRIHFQRGEFASAIREFELALQINPYYVWCLNDLVWAHWLLGNFQEARQLLERVLEINPQDEGAYMGLAFMQYFEGSYEKALTSICRSIELNPSYPFSRAILAIILAAQGCFEEAAAVCLEPAGSDLENFLNKASLGIVYQQKGDEENLERTNEEVMTMRPFYTPLNLNYAIYYSMLHNEYWARRFLQKGFAEGIVSRQILSQNPYLTRFKDEFGV